MSYITLHATKLQHNFKVLDQVFKSRNIEWAIVAKLLCGNEKFLNILLDLSDKEICDSRLSNLKTIKKLSPKTQTIYIKPPAKRLAKSIVQFADVSFNTELSTLEELSAEAVKQNKIHKVVVMVEMGELREGVMARNLMSFYDDVLALPNIEVVAIGTNLNCLNGILPDEKKLVKLSSFKQIIEEHSGHTIPYISGGSSVTIPLIFKDEIPLSINHFRIGETLFFGTNVYTDSLIKGMYHDVFTLTAEIIEMQEKPTIPSGTAGTNLTGETPVFSAEDKGKSSVRAIVDIGLLDIDYHDIVPFVSGIEMIGASSDMLILDLGENEQDFKVGDTLDFSMNYMAVLRAMNSDYVDKKVETVILKNKLPIGKINVN
ncbi:alanine/ornithine racemase family PLP-dependent enzyme [Chryseobacterium sp. SNU WT5]|uniref:alanine racemase n=1 Tax=Chryseobacterium sp. SNU WT5 TaxID=2594269 RepID=UPI00117DE6D2|nr:alanine/ornithine racemase family PLP-dependent enzyme [Chryseobacterium sp. SNU WT5]QDP86288.1 alanine/ornithine racemase family PLP-dependent enzyme [Chryseobacterium sp. SNU WT5]